MQAIDFWVWFGSQAEAAATIDVSPFGNFELSGLPRAEADQKQDQQPARDGQAERVRNVVAASCLA